MLIQPFQAFVCLKVRLNFHLTVSCICTSGFWLIFLEDIGFYTLIQLVSRICMNELLINFYLKIQDFIC